MPSEYLPQSEKQRLLIKAGTALVLHSISIDTYSQGIGIRSEPEKNGLGD